MKIEQLQQVLAAIFYLANRLQSQGDKVHPELTMRQWMLLLTAAHLKEDASYSTIALTMGCSKQNVKQLAVALFKKGYLLQMPHPKDHRAVWLNVTAEGRSVMQQYYQGRDALLLPLTELYTETELTEFLALLGRLIGFDHPNWRGYDEQVAFLSAAPPSFSREDTPCPHK